MLFKKNIKTRMEKEAIYKEEEAIPLELILKTKINKIITKHAVIFWIVLSQFFIIVILIIIGIYILHNQYRNLSEIAHQAKITRAEIVQISNDQIKLSQTIQKGLANNALAISQKLKSFKKNLQSMAETQKSLRTLANVVNKKVSTLFASVEKNISEYDKSLQDIILKSKKNHNQLSKKDLAITSNLKESKKYRLYAVESYGVVLQDNDGRYIIAQIGKTLPIGMITEISASEVIAGSWKIIPKKTLDVDLNTYQ